MTIYAVFGLQQPQVVESNIIKHYANAHYNAGNGVFFISSETDTTIEVGVNLGFGNSDSVPRTSGIIVPVFNYWGRYDPNLWEWISTKQRVSS